MTPPPRAVTFDFGQVLASFDPGFLVTKLAERGLGAGDESAFERALPAGWAAYGEALRAGEGGEAAWKTLLRTVLVEGGASADDALLSWLFIDQLTRNLWRKPVRGMIELVRELGAAGVPVGVVSNSEGALAALAAELGWLGDFACIADSGALGFEKPGREIFDWAAARLGVQAHELVHVGDSWVADVEGALGVGARAVWFVDAPGGAPPEGQRVLPAGVRLARSAHEARAALRAFGVWPRAAG